jgi:hypothetical protein
MPGDASRRSFAPTFSNADRDPRRSTEQMGESSIHRDPRTVVSHATNDNTLSEAVLERRHREAVDDHGYSAAATPAAKHCITQCNRSLRVSAGEAPRRATPAVRSVSPPRASAGRGGECRSVRVATSPRRCSAAACGRVPSAAAPLAATQGSGHQIGGGGGPSLRGRSGCEARERPGCRVFADRCFVVGDVAAEDLVVDRTPPLTPRLRRRGRRRSPRSTPRLGGCVWTRRSSFAPR